VSRSAADYLLDSSRELERLTVQARVWESAGRATLAEVGDGTGLRALDVGCGALGWLRVLSDWVGPEGEVVGTDIVPSLIDAARTIVSSDALRNVTLVEDDLFASELPAASFDLVHARFQLAPIGREADQFAAYTRWLRPGGVLVLEDPDPASWRIHPNGEATRRLVDLVLAAFRAGGGDFASGTRLPALLRSVGVEAPRARATVHALEHGDPYLRLPLQFATSLEARLVPALIDADELRSLREAAEAELTPEAWGTTFTLVSAWGNLPV
jgi:SAM-dependent methyltransferase